MPKRAFLFPGQGSQAVGMGRDLFEGFPEARAVFETADRVLGFPLSKLCFEGPEGELKKTSVTQPALLAVSVASLEALKAQGTVFDAVAGHSLGTYSALVASKALTLPDALKLVRRRGELMEQVGAGRGTMAAILGLSDEKVREACEASAAAGIVEPANVNCPGQVVISGETGAVKAACAKAKELGAKRAVELAVSGPFHSSLMEPAAEAFRVACDSAAFGRPDVAYYSDTEARPLSDPEEIRRGLVRQLTSPVQWTRTISRMADDGIGEFVEVGPGRVLCGLVAKIRPQAKTLNVGDKDTLMRSKETLC